MKNGFYPLLCSFMIISLMLSSAGLVDREKSFTDTVSNMELRLKSFGKIAERALDGASWLYDSTFGDTDYTMFPYYASLKNEYSSSTVVSDSLEAVVVSLYCDAGVSLDPNCISGVIPAKVVNAVYLSDMYTYVYGGRGDYDDFVKQLVKELGGFNKIWCWILYRGSPDVYGAEEYKKILADAESDGLLYYKDGWKNHFSTLFYDSDGKPYYSSP